MKYDMLEKRFAYLSDVLEADQNRDLFIKTRDLLFEVFSCLNFDKNPDIGVDDEGRSIAEWHDYNGYSVFSIVPYSANKILFEGMKKDDTTFSIATGIKNLKHKDNGMFFFGLEHNYAISA